MFANLLSHSADIFLAVIRQSTQNGSDVVMKQNIHKMACDLYMKELQEITSEDHGWHFGAFHATTMQLEEFCLENMAQDIKIHAPMLWKLFDQLLSGPSDELHSESVQDKEGNCNGPTFYLI